VQQVRLVHDESSVEQFGSAGAHPALHDCVHTRHANASLHGGDAFVYEDRVECGGVLAVAVADQVLHRHVGVVEVHDQIPGEFRRPARGGVRGGAEDTDAAGGVFDDGDDV
jgi:hypothetical protein